MGRDLKAIKMKLLGGNCEELLYSMSSFHDHCFDCKHMGAGEEDYRCMALGSCPGITLSEPMKASLVEFVESEHSD